MSNKKQLLTESEIRRFMALANIPAIKENFATDGGIQEDYMEEEDENPMGGEEDPSMDSMGPEEEPSEEPSEESPEEPMDSPMGAGGSKEEQFADAIKTLASLSNIKVDFGDEGGEDSEPEDDEMADVDDESSDEPADDEVDLGGSDEEGEEGEGGEEEELQEQLVQTILSRVTARLVAEAKKGGAKSSLKDRLKKARDAKKGKGGKSAKPTKSDKEKIEEANAAAPKASNTNAPKKGAGSATKGTWGTSHPRKDDSWEKGTTKRGDKMEVVSPSAEDLKTHGKKNLATLGGIKKK